MQLDGSMGVCRRPLAHFRMTVSGGENFVKPANGFADTEQRPRLVERGHDCAGGEFVPADVATPNGLPLERVPAVVATARVEEGNPVADCTEVVTDLGWLGASYWDVEDVERFVQGVGAQQRPVVPATSDFGGNVIRCRPTAGHVALPSRRVLYSSMVIVWSRENVPVGLSTKPIAFT
jgi:hypothetical protein